MDKFQIGGLQDDARDDGGAASLLDAFASDDAFGGGDAGYPATGSDMAIGSDMATGSDMQPETSLAPEPEPEPEPETQTGLDNSFGQMNMSAGAYSSAAAPDSYSAPSAPVDDSPAPGSYSANSAAFNSPPAVKSSPPAGSYSASSSAVDESPKPKPRFGGGDVCPRCKKTVYFAEAREGPNSLKYHRPCFACAICKKTLDSSFTERQGEIYCKGCYAKEFGPKMFGFSPTSTTEGSAVSSSPQASWRSSQSPQAAWRASQTPEKAVNRSYTPGSAGSSGSSSRFGGGEKCPRCQKTVYAAEAKEVNGVKYHRPCFTCLSCAKTLDSHFAERQGDLHCKPCYNKLYGPKGFGYSGTT